MITPSIDLLEIRALQQRQDIHHAIGELKDKVAAARAKLDLTTNARKHLLRAALFVSSIGFLTGHGFAGLFTRR